MHWIVDGNNVVGARPDGWWRDRAGAKARLVDQLRELARYTGEPVTVFFDGRPVALPEAPELTVRFAGTARNAADDAIVGWLEQAGAADVRVISSDADLVARAGARGAVVEGAGAFRRRLDELVAPEGGR
jgi:predicted RNA-binding protein with PIN domain